MEQQKNSLEDPEERLDKFKEGIEKLKEEEKEQGKIALAEVDPKELTLEDLEVWKKVEDETITQEETTQYMKGLIDEKGKARDDISPSRIKFMAFVNNKAGIVVVKREMMEENP